MSTKHIVIAGATGKTGTKLASLLLAQGFAVTALVHHANSPVATELAAQGARIQVGELADEAFLRDALSAADAFYGLLPYNYGAPNLNEYQSSIARTMQRALAQSPVREVVALSSFGAHGPYPDSVLLGLQEMESRLSALNGKHVRIVRAGFFYENFLGMAGLAKQQHQLGGFPLDGTVRAPMVATEDIAHYAADRFSRADFTGFSVVHVAGPEVLSFDEAATQLGAAVGDPALHWTNFGYDGAQQGMRANGFSASTAAGFASFARQANDGELWGYYTPAAGAVTATSLSDFAPTFKRAYDAAV